MDFKGEEERRQDTEPLKKQAYSFRPANLASCKTLHKIKY